MLFDIPKNDRSIIKVIGVGGGGGNAVGHMFNQGITGVDFAICNTDNQALESNPVLTKIQLGPHLTEGRGAGTKPEIGKQACIESIDDVRNFLNDGTKMLFVTAGLGGGTGTGAAPIIAKAAKELDILTVGIVTLPFKFEGLRRHNQAIAGLEDLKRNVDAILVISNDKVRESYGDLALSDAFDKADSILTTAAKGIAEIITIPGYINVDFEDVNTVMRDSGVAMLGNAYAEGEDRARKAIHEALNSPLLEDNDIRGAQHILLNITSGTKEVTMDEIGEITDYVQEEAGYGTDLIWGNCKDESLGDKLSITLIATGFQESDHKFNKEEPQKIIVSLEEQAQDNEPVFSKGLTDGEKSHVVELNTNKTFQREEMTAISQSEEQKVFDIKEEMPTFKPSPKPSPKPKDKQESKSRIHLDDARRKYLRENFSKPIDNPKMISDLENVPAYKRRNVELENVDQGENHTPSRLSISMDEDQPLQRNNQFLHDNVD